MGAVSAVTAPTLDAEVDKFVQRLLAAPTPALLAVKDYVQTRRRSTSTRRCNMRAPCTR